MKKVKISSSVEDFYRISKEYKEAKARQKDQKSIRDTQYDEYLLKTEEAEDVVSDNISNIIQDATDGEFIKNVDVSVYIRSSGDDDVRSEITVNYGNQSRTNGTVPLSWNWTFKLYNNEKQRKTSSWSGLAATTQEDIDVLKKSISALEALASVTDDYIVDVISKNALNYYDYVTQEVEDDIDSISYIIKKLEALAGTGYYINIGDYDRFEDFIRIDKDTGKQFSTTTVRIRKPYTEDGHTYPSDKYITEEKRYRKDKLAEMIKDNEGVDFTIYSV